MHIHGSISFDVGILGPTAKYFEGVEANLTDAQRNVLSNLQRGLDEEVKIAYGGLCEIQRNNLVEQEPMEQRI